MRLSRNLISLFKFKLKAINYNGAVIISVATSTVVVATPTVVLTAVPTMPQPCNNITTKIKPISFFKFFTFIPYKLTTKSFT